MTLHTKEMLEEKYSVPDPWAFETNADDAERKRRILAALNAKRFARALDVGAGEGFITRDLPADTIHAIELSDEAAARFPANVRRVYPDDMEVGSYDLVVATGVFYEHYDWKLLRDVTFLATSSLAVVLTCHLEDSEIVIPYLSVGRKVHVERFPYRGRTQVLRVYALHQHEIWSQ